MKKSKKILALVMAIVMATGMLSASFVALAGDDDAYVPETSYERAEVILNYLNYNLVEGTLLADIIGLLADPATLGLRADNTIVLVADLLPLLDGMMAELFGGEGYAFMSTEFLLALNDGNAETGVEAYDFLSAEDRATIAGWYADPDSMPADVDLYDYLDDEMQIIAFDYVLDALLALADAFGGLGNLLSALGLPGEVLDGVDVDALLSGLPSKLAYDPVGTIFDLLPIVGGLLPTIYGFFGEGEDALIDLNPIMNDLIASLPDLLAGLLIDLIDITPFAGLLVPVLTSAANGIDFNADPFKGLVDYLNKLLPSILPVIGTIAGTTISAANWVNLPYINITFTDTTDHAQMLIDLFDGMCGLINTLLDNLVPALLPLLGGLIEGVDLSGLGVAEVAEVLGLMLGIDIPMNGGKFAITGETVVDLIYVLLFPADSDDEDDDEKKTTTSKDSGSTDGDGTEDIAQTGDIFVSVMSIFALASGAALVLTKKKES